MMEFPIVDLMSVEDCYEWLMSHFHPEEPIGDEVTETDEMFQNAGEKRLLASC